MVTWIWELTIGNYDLSSLSFFSNTNGQKKKSLKYSKL